jgi:hypothetical protein
MTTPEWLKPWLRLTHMTHLTNPAETHVRAHLKKAYAKCVNMRHASCVMSDPPAGFLGAFTLSPA